MATNQIAAAPSTYVELAHALRGIVQSQPGLTLYAYRKLLALPATVHNSFLYRVAWELAKARHLQPLNLAGRTLWYPVTPCACLHHHLECVPGAVNVPTSLVARGPMEVQ